MALAPHQAAGVLNLAGLLLAKATSQGCIYGTNAAERNCISSLSMFLTVGDTHPYCEEASRIIRPFHLLGTSAETTSSEKQQLRAFGAHTPGPDLA